MTDEIVDKSLENLVFRYMIHGFQIRGQVTQIPEFYSNMTQAMYLADKTEYQKNYMLDAIFKIKSHQKLSKRKLTFKRGVW